MNTKTLLGKSILIISSIVVALLLAEGIVRVMGLSPEVVYIEKWRVRLAENPKIAYEPIPNLDSKGKSSRYYSYVGMSNNMGFRDYDHSIKKEQGSKRIIILGDSVTQGLWINDDSKIFSVVMEKKLRELGHKVDVMNFGVSGYNTQQEVETLIDKGLHFNPDLVILAYCLNDKIRNDGGIYGSLLSAELKSKKEGKIAKHNKFHPIVKHSDLLRFLRYVVFSDKNQTEEKHSPGQKVNKLYSPDNVEKHFGILGDLAKKQGFDVNVFIFPDFGKNDEGIVAGWENYSYAKEHEIIKDLADKNNLHHYDLYGLFRECRKESSKNVSWDRYHPNTRGNECAGRKMAEYLSVNGF